MQKGQIYRLLPAGICHIVNKSICEPIPEITLRMSNDRDESSALVLFISSTPEAICSMLDFIISVAS